MDSETTTTIVTSTTTTTTEKPTTAINTTTTKDVTTTTTVRESPTTTITAPLPTTTTTTQARTSPSVTPSTASSPSVTSITSTPITTSTTPTQNNYPDSKVYEMEFPVTEISEEQRLEHDSRSILTYPQIYQLGPTRNDLNLDRCDDVAANWNCSSGQSQHSVCIRQCSTDYHSEAIKCKCKHQVCQWEQKGKSCTRTTLFNQDSVRADVPLSKPFQFSHSPSQGLQTGAQTVFGENFLRNDDEEHRIVQPQVLNFTPGGPRAQRGMSAGTPGNAEFDQNSFPQFLRDINLSNMGQMIFNVNYFNSYASTTSPKTV